MRAVERRARGVVTADARAVEHYAAPRLRVQQPRGTPVSGPRQIVRLREARLTSASQPLALAREETKSAERAKRAAKAQADRKRCEMIDTRDRLAGDLDHAAT